MKAFIQSDMSGNYFVKAESEEKLVDAILTDIFDDAEEKSMGEVREEIEDSIQEIKSFGNLLSFCREYGIPKKRGK